MFVIPDGTSLVNYLLDFTGSSDTAEIKQCVFLAELMMRNIELPALRTNPYTTTGVVNDQGLVPIPADMNKPILFFMNGNSQPSTSTTSTGPWIVFDRVGDRDIITLSLLAQWYLQPANVPTVVHGKFSEVGQSYQFLPYLGSGTVVNLYYYRAWNLLFTPLVVQNVLSTTGTVGSITGSGSGPWTCVISGLTSTTTVAIGDTVTAVSGTGSLGSTGLGTVTAITSTTLTVSVSAVGTTPVAGSVTTVTQTTAGTVQTNEVLQTWPEGYVYSALHCYYTKRHSPEDAAMYLAKYTEAWETVENQNNLGKWNGGNTRMTSIFQPRQMQMYSVK